LLFVFVINDYPPMVTAHYEGDLRVVFIAVDVDVGCGECPLTLGAVCSPIRVLDFHVAVVIGKDHRVKPYGFGY
jgi:hypothetical protein